MSLAWVTGAGGFIGRWLSRSLAGAGERVAGLGHGAFTDAADWGVTDWLEAEIDGPGLDALLGATGLPDTVYHLAGGASVRAAFDDPAADHDRTVTGSRSLLDWLARRAPTARVVVVSSAAVYGEASSGPIGEDAPTAPVSAYGRHKLQMELLALAAREKGQQITVARLFSVYGEGLRKQLLWDLAGRVAARPAELTLGGTGRELRDWTHVGDIAAVLPRLAALGERSPAVVNIATGRGVAVEDVARTVLAAWPSPARLAFDGQQRPGDPFSLIADTTLAESLGLACPTHVETGIPRTIAWSRAALAGAPA
jgi:UDP-glucose 4-epimerase